MKNDAPRHTTHRLRITALLFVAALFTAPLSLAQTTDDVSALKESIKQEVLQELRESVNGEASRSSEIEALKEDLKREILQELLEEMRNENKTAAPPTPPVATPNAGSNTLQLHVGTPGVGAQPGPQPVTEGGRTANGQFLREEMGIAAGQILRNGVGLPGCKIKLVLLQGNSTINRGYQQGREYETVTDTRGFYRVADLVPGKYKLKWQLPGDTGWIRRLWDRPDVTVKAGQMADIKPVETARRIVGQ
jgi:hypothetical protein